MLALLPPWVLIYLVSGKEGFKDGWPLAIVGSLGYILGQWPVAYYFGPYLPDVTGSIVCFCALLLLLKVWRPARILGHGGSPVSAAELAREAAREHGLTDRRSAAGLDALRRAGRGGRGVDRSVVQPAGGRLVFRPGAGDSRRKPRPPSRRRSSSPRGSAAARSWRPG